MLTVAFDGVTVNRKSKVLFTVTRGIVSRFLTWGVDLGSDVYVTDAEADTAFGVIMNVKKDFDGLGVMCIPVDNAPQELLRRLSRGYMRRVTFHSHFET